MRLVTNKGRFATKDNSMIFSNIVWLIDESDIKLYHLIDIDGKEIDCDLHELLIVQLKVIQFSCI